MYHRKCYYAIVLSRSEEQKPPTVAERAKMQIFVRGVEETRVMDVAEDTPVQEVSLRFF